MKPAVHGTDEYWLVLVAGATAIMTPPGATKSHVAPWNATAAKPEHAHVKDANVGVHANPCWHGVG